jgi:ribosomal protein S30
MHGSMTKSGKVRKQTPKVEKKERLTKSPVGRAGKRKKFQRKATVLISGDKKLMKKFKPNNQFVDMKN